MTNFILPHALPSALDGREGIQLLSLDCFDTLLWRDSHSPIDIFHALPAINALQRQWAELRARQASIVQHLRKEVTIGEIYRQLLPNASKEAVKAAIEAELDTEARHCFAYPPAVALMQEAKKRGLRIIIVSDTYLDADQLRNLIARSAGAEVAALIDRIFCSSTYGRSKSEGLYEDVLKKVKCAPEAILHIGDNLTADVGGVAPFGVNTLHLKQFTETTEQRFRLEATIGAMLEPTPLGAITSPQPHRATIATGEPQIQDAAEALGFTVIGPVFHTFERWLQREAATLQAERGGTVHWLFLMRDGFLPMRFHQDAADGVDGHPVEISRFTSTAASLTTEAAVRRYLEFEVGGEVEKLANQLLSPADAKVVLKQLPAKLGRTPAFLREVYKPQRMKQILKAGREACDRLIAHVRATVDPQPGDTLMLVDLGYNGTVQNEVEALLRDRLKVHVAGRYLLLREHFQSGLDKKGLLDESQCEFRTLEALSTNVAVFEQICAASQGSTIGYRDDGTPIRKSDSIKERQSGVRDRVQAGALRFQQASAATSVRAESADTLPVWRNAAATILCRMMFLPMAHELAVLTDFEHDLNHGADNTVELFDPAVAKRGLHQRGLFYLRGAERMYLPAELHGEGLPVKLALLAQKRFGLPLKYADFVDSTIALPLIVADGVHATTGTVTATPTHDGYYMAPIPIEDCRFSVGVQFGQLFDWVQIESATFLPVDRFLAELQRSGVEEVAANPSLEGMHQVAPHLFHCDNEFAFMMVPPPKRVDDRPMVLQLVFRPIARRETATLETVPQPSLVHAPGVR